MPGGFLNSINNEKIRMPADSDFSGQLREAMDLWLRNQPDIRSIAVVVDWYEVPTQSEPTQRPVAAFRQAEGPLDPEDLGVLMGMLAALGQAQHAVYENSRAARAAAIHSLESVRRQLDQARRLTACPGGNEETTECQSEQPE